MLQLKIQIIVEFADSSKNQECHKNNFFIAVWKVLYQLVPRYANNVSWRKLICNF